MLEFCDQACAAEVGLETKRKPQPIDPTNPGYRNPTIDISDAMIKSMAMFVASLPAPTREIPQDSADRQAAIRGEQLFENIGCAVCHVPNLGQVQGLYSDLLLHDMGSESIDLNPADPYIIRMTPTTTYSEQLVSSSQRSSAQFDDTVSTTYYGNTTSMSGLNTVSSNAPNSRRRGPSQNSRGNRLGNMNYDFVVPMQPATTIRFIPLHSDSRLVSSTNVENKNYKKNVNANQKTASGRDFYNVDETTTTNRVVRQISETYLRVHIEPTNFTQEWRTPPLWGVRDSAPYLHDGRAETILEAIALHEGESAGTRDRFLNLSFDDRNAIVAFLNTMIAPRTADGT